MLEWISGLSVIKEAYDLVKMTEADPIDPGTIDAAKLKEWGLIPADESPEDYAWAAPRRMFELTEAPGCTREIAWVSDQLRRTKRKVVRKMTDGAIDLILVRKKRP